MAFPARIQRGVPSTGDQHRYEQEDRRFSA
ncbi:hypothetical protein KC19_VG024200 [Ceratodon purpureus]|uniref:Uncharacterized protein n=1 Tax=Ceratodon purpureus TaxID=3225 RepID=A0A8T0HLB1_CERPU|nr:hypothetical protein KC19_VG024200 [Ceratodon purpureus]